jgi:HD-GYP domain-containing protein (c-di-GMP phosphodiesterase class II)
MMTIADIFDTLTACDRPWSRAIPVPRALEIMREEVRSKLLDPDLFQIFLDSKVYEVTARD